jgi:hypothetical protein
MRRAKHVKRLRYLAAALIVAAVSAFSFLHWRAQGNALPHPAKRQTGIGYKAEDRKKLEQIIHQGSKDD